MRVALVCHGLFPDQVGGMERHTFFLARAMKESGIDIQVLVPEPNRGTPHPFPVHYLPWPWRPTWLWSHRIFSQAVANWIEENAVDVAWGQGFGLWKYQTRKKRVPCIFHPHGLEMFGQALRPRERIVTIPFRHLVRCIGASANLTISLGGNLTNMLKDQAGIAPERIREIPNAVPEEEFPAPEKGHRSQELLFVGRWVFNKGIDLLAQALALLPNVPFHLSMVGEGPEKNVIEALARRDSRVHLLGRLSGEALRQEFHKHQALLFTSRFEGMPTVILEAMASGCAAVATDVGAVRELVNTELGILCPPTAEGIARAIRQFLALPTLAREKMGAEGRRRVEEKFFWRSVTPSVLALLQEVSCA